MWPYCSLPKEYLMNIIFWKFWQCYTNCELPLVIMSVLNWTSYEPLETVEHLFCVLPTYLCRCLLIITSFEMKPTYKWEISVSMNKADDNRSHHASSLTGLSSSYVHNVCFMLFQVGLNWNYMWYTSKFPFFLPVRHTIFVQEFQMSVFTFMMYFYITLIKYFNYNRDSR